MLKKLERWFGPFAIPNLTAVLTMSLTLTFGMRLLWPESVLPLEFSRAHILQGEVWRLITFMLIAPPGNPLFAAFGLYLFYLMGTALENEWGEFRFNFYMFVGYLATLAVGWFSPYGGGITNTFVLGSVFLAFAYLYPDFEILLFFLLPIKIKWLALLTWLGYGASLIFGTWTERLLVLAAILNFLLFFGVEIFSGARAAKRRMAFKAQLLTDTNQPFHRCEKCGATEDTHPDLEFRVCEECTGEHEYCLVHIDEHPHR